MTYKDFILSKRIVDMPSGFEPSALPPDLFDFQQACVSWACRRGRSALFEDCGLGKTPQQKVCGIIFSFPAAVWPQDARRQREWIERLTPWWDMTMPDWTPQAHRLRESCVKAINNLTRPDGPETAHRERRAESLNESSSQMPHLRR